MIHSLATCMCGWAIHARLSLGFISKQTHTPNTRTHVQTHENEHNRIAANESCSIEPTHTHTHKHIDDEHESSKNTTILLFNVLINVHTQLHRISSDYYVHTRYARVPAELCFFTQFAWPRHFTCTAHTRSHI